MDYVFQRSLELRCDKELLKSTSRLRNSPSIYKETKLSSSALGDNFLKIIEMPGRVVMDVMKIVQRDHKLDRFGWVRRCAAEPTQHCDRFRKCVNMMMLILETQTMLRL